MSTRKSQSQWIPAFAGMTPTMSRRESPSYGVHFLCAWIDITTPNPASSVIAEVPP